MDPNPTVLKQTNVISTAARYIMEQRYRNLPVVDEDGCYLGVFGVNCLLRLVLPRAVVMEKGLDSVAFIHESLADLHERLRKVENEPGEMRHRILRNRSRILNQGGVTQPHPRRRETLRGLCRTFANREEQLDLDSLAQLF